MILGNTFTLLRRQARVILLFGLVGLIASVFYLATARPIYEARASLLMDSSQVYAIGSTMAPVGGVADEAMSSQIELIRSQRVANLVVDDLNLVADPRFENVQSPLAALRAWAVGLLDVVGLASDDPASPLFAGEQPPKSPEEAYSAAVENLRAMVLVHRVPLTYVVDIKYQSPFPDLAVSIVNSVSNSFLRHQVSASVDASVKASEWLNQRIEEARLKSEEAGIAVERYRAENNLVSTGGRLIGEAQLGEINMRLLDARAAMSQAQASYEQALAVLNSNDAEAVISALVGEDSARALLARYDDARKRLAALSERLDPAHEQVARANEEIEQIVQQMRDELGRVVDNRRRGAELSEQNVADLERRLSEVAGQNSEANIRVITLQELERSAQTYRDLHQSLLVRQQEVLQSGSLPSVQAQIINDAFVPEEPVSPNRPFSLIVFTLAGLVLGGIIGLFREITDRTFRNGEHLTRATGLAFAGYLPDFSVSAPYSPRVDKDLYLDYVRTHPQSMAASTLRNIRVAVDLARPRVGGGQTVSITSSLKGEGKTTLAVNLARLLAGSGFKVILIDLDMWNPSMSRSLKTDQTPAIQDVIERRATLADVVTVDKNSSARLARAASRRANMEQFFASPELQDHIDKLRTKYDYVILDFPPLAIITDASLLIRYSDVVVLAVQWGKTSRAVVERVVTSAQQTGANIICGVLTTANPHKVKRFEEPDWEPRQYQYSSYSDAAEKS